MSASPESTGLQRRKELLKPSFAAVESIPARSLEAEQYRVVKAHLERPTIERHTLEPLWNLFGSTLHSGFPTNELKTSKYTAITFLPVNLFEQFSRVANLYFLLIAALQLIPGLSPTSWFTTVCPLVIVLAINGVKEGWDDIKRHKNDDHINNRSICVLIDDDQELEVSWKDVQVGDLVKVRNNSEVAADLLLLSSSDAEGLCYVETANLDGETNLKIKFCHAKTAGAHGSKDLASFVEHHTVYCEHPNPKLYVFDGYVQGEKGQKDPLDATNLLLRGCTLRKTDWVIGLVVFTGGDTKIVQNMIPAILKVTQLEQHMNVLVTGMFLMLFTFAVCLSIAQQVWLSQNSGSVWYIAFTGVWPDLAAGFAGWLVQVIRFLILLNQIIPISLYVTLEMVKVLQCALLLNKDIKMYHEDSDTPFQCRTSTLNEDLGQVEYVLSDKTGTLTQNMMGFVWASVGGRMYGKSTSPEAVSLLSPSLSVPAGTPHSLVLDPELHRGLRSAGAGSGPGAELERFFINLAVCNTVVPTLDENGQLLYQASSPDEEALVEGAAYLGYRLLSRNTDIVQVEYRGLVWVYDILAVLEFNSERKRMSVVVRTPEGRVLLLCKGADTVMMARAVQGQPGLPAIEAHLGEMARAGLRTLVMGERELQPEEYEAWAERFHEASVALDARDVRLAETAEQVEGGLTLLGATAVEDKLQEGVPEAIAALGAGGVKVWMLTGDKVETAISIAHSCRLFTPSMAVITLWEAEVSVRDHEHTNLVLGQKLEEVEEEETRRWGSGDGHGSVGLVVEGGALVAALHESCQEALLALCKACRSVVCCRVSPMQKAQVTNLVKRRAGAITLAIGDGANDVGMITAAHVGVGISGREGRAAVLAANFSFAQFRYLSRLLLLHGRWAYIRNREVVYYAFYKNFMYCMCMIIYSFYTGFSAQPLYPTLCIATYNVLWTSVPTIAFAVLEQDVSAATALAFPALYSQTMRSGRRKFLSGMGLWLGEAVAHSLLLYFTVVAAFSAGGGRGAAVPSSMDVGTAVWVAVVITANLKISTRTHYWTWINMLSVVLSVALIFPFLLAMGLSYRLFPSQTEMLGDMSQTLMRHVPSRLIQQTLMSHVPSRLIQQTSMRHVGQFLVASPSFWLMAVLGTPAMCVLCHIALLAFQRLVAPTASQQLQDWEVDVTMMSALQRAEIGKADRRRERSALPQPAL